MKKTILAFFTHVDDLEYGGAATYAKFIKEGYEGYHVLTTRSNSGTGINLELEKSVYGFAIPSNQLSRIRKEEQSKAGKWLGTKEHIFMDLKEHVYTTKDLRVLSPDLKNRSFGDDQPEGREPVEIAAGKEEYIREVEEIFTRIEPAITLTFSPHVNPNPDHSTTGLMALKGYVRASKRVKLGPMYAPMNLTFEATYSPYFVPVSDRWIVEVSECLEQVCRAEGEFKCQRGASYEFNVNWIMGLRRRYPLTSWGNKNENVTEMIEEFWKIIDWDEAKDLEV